MLLFNLVDNKEFREECLNEILEAVRNQDIVLDSCCLSADKEDNARAVASIGANIEIGHRINEQHYLSLLGIDNSARRELEKAKEGKMPYSIEVRAEKLWLTNYKDRWETEGNIVPKKNIPISCLVPPSLPDRTFFVGTTRNKGFDFDYATWEGKRREIYADSLFFDDPTTEGLEQFRKDYEDWKNTTIEWLKKDPTCPECSGLGVSVGVTISPSKQTSKAFKKTCDYCNGYGSIDAFKIRRRALPELPAAIDPYATIGRDQEVTRELFRKMHEVCKIMDMIPLLEPLENNVIYIRIVNTARG